jgi:hypothetical protein
MYKQGNAYLYYTWSKRYFQLDVVSQSLQWYIMNNKGQRQLLRGSAKLNKCHVSNSSFLQSGEIKGYMFKVTLDKKYDLTEVKTLILLAATEESANKWINMFTTASNWDAICEERKKAEENENKKKKLITSSAEKVATNEVNNNNLLKSSYDYSHKIYMFSMIICFILLPVIPIVCFPLKLQSFAYIAIVYGLYSVYYIFHNDNIKF